MSATFPEIRKSPQEKGSGVAKDLAEAFRWYRKAAEHSVEGNESNRTTQSLRG